ncbi:SIMPL domain-containing protein [Corynebacterium halotolerans]|uniref:SIMPL domain-containing protein n=1 Tax=Corynebacterium halotolerans YIM 70093 = DSM 44683 TaxID=1121362 RepID=M1NPT0_9CORY|nr:SIMPL domain-containing protein [Corynebacterium halotolerans]AGF71487.1 hypothetical protein A605_02365 [Corynebacterium halotolerans YIM 70093 = DSM 44683]
MPRSLPGPQQPIVEVRGEAGRYVPADMCSIRLRVRSEHRLADRAYRLRKEGVDVVRQVLGTLGSLRVEGERLDESTSHREGATVASWGVTVTGAAGDRGELREVIARLAAVEDIGVDGPDWQLSPALRAQVRRELLADAARTARAEAEVLADALGGTVGRLLYVTDRDDAGDWRIEQTAAAGLLPDGAAGNLPERTLELDLEPERIELTAAVTAEFEVDFAG